MRGPNDEQVPAIDAGHGRDPEPLGDSHDAGVDQAQVEVGVGPDQLTAASPVRLLEVGQGEVAAGDGGDDGGLDSRPEPWSR